MRNGRLRQGRRGAAEFTATIIAPMHGDAWERGAAQGGRTGGGGDAGGCLRFKVRRRYVPTQAAKPESGRREINGEENTRIIRCSGR